MNCSKKLYPFISICTPTFNRPHFIEPLIEMVRNQNYPKNRIEWLIYDDGFENVKCYFDKVDFVKVKYFHHENQQTLGFKRNLLNSKCEGEIIIYFDDDDYYPPDRICHAVEVLEKNNKYLIAGSSCMHIYYHHLNEIYKCGPYSDNHSTAATFAFRRELLKQTQFSDESAISE